MGDRGPVPLPTAIKRAQGMRADRINDQEPRPELPGAVPEPPEYLDAVGRETWGRLAPSLYAMGMLTEWDVDVFAYVCDLISTVRQAGALVHIALLTKGRRDQLVTNPAWRIYRDGLLLLRQYAREFGLTPSARSGFVVELDPQTGHVRLERSGTIPRSER